ncbi:hypothetical protein BpHYR1_014135 [Brachionus plicatilis]|uniref:Uncharacterized protein n=1 Tax=Brachionus plicatilis TaxID=10195 RepID=A0A3M7QT67_BRAPC|nr:hypothetical protein BpHYR1_014135 [Brachionus plicatilis]
MKVESSIITFMYNTNKLILSESALEILLSFNQISFQRNKIRFLTLYQLIHRLILINFDREKKRRSSKNDSVLSQHISPSTQKVDLRLLSRPHFLFDRIFIKFSLELQRSLISSIIEEKQDFSTEIFIFHLKSYFSNSTKRRFLNLQEGTVPKAWKRRFFNIKLWIRSGPQTASPFKLFNAIIISLRLNGSLNIG